MKSLVLKHAPSLFLILLAILFFYSKITGAFFEQDEWHSFSFYNYLASLDTKGFIANAFGGGILSHFTPLSLLFKMSLFKTWGIVASNYFWVSILGHFLVSVALYTLLFKIFKKIIPALLGAIFFAINSSSYQAVTWLGTFEGTQGAALFGIFSILFSYYFIEKKKIVFIVLSSLSLFLSMLFKETGLSFIPLLFLIYFFSKEKKLKVTGLLMTIFVLVVYVALKICFSFYGSGLKESAADISNINWLSSILYNTLTLPIKVLPQLLLPSELLISIADWIAPKTNWFFTYTPAPWFHWKVLVYDLVTIFLGILTLISIYFLSRKIENKKNFYLGISFIIFSLAPLILVRKFYTYLDSRYLYLTLIGVVIVFASIVERFSVKKYFIFFILLAVVHGFYLTKTVKSLVSDGQVRKNILEVITLKYPNINNESVFYIKSDTQYYLLSERLLPFQSGVGNVLLVTYGLRQIVPVEFFRDFYLWEIRSQGFRSEQGFGFGYYYDYNILERDLKAGKFSKESIYAFEWYGKENKLIDVTNEFKNEKN